MIENCKEIGTKLIALIDPNNYGNVKLVWMHIVKTDVFIAEIILQMRFAAIDIILILYNLFLYL